MNFEDLNQEVQKALNKRENWHIESPNNPICALCQKKIDDVVPIRLWIDNVEGETLEIDFHTNCFFDQNKEEGDEGEHYPTKEELDERNATRIKDIQNHDEAYCPQERCYISDLMKCMFCHYGHMTECHYPYDCNSDYCNHYKQNEGEGEPIF